MNKSILIVLEDFNVGGAQTFAIRLANALSSSCEVFLYNVKPTIYDYKISQLISPKVKILSYSNPIYLFLAWIFEKPFRLFPALKKTIHKKYELFELWRIEHKIKKYKIEVVNSHMFHADAFVRKLKVKNPTIKHFISMHGCYENKLSELQPNILENSLLNLKSSNGIIIASKKNLEIVEKLKIEAEVNVQNIYYGFETVKDLESPSPNKYFTYGIASRAIKEKGWEVLIEAFLELNHKYSDTRLVLVGESKFQQTLKAKYKNINSITFIGHSSYVLEHIRNFDVGVLPTFFKGESLPNSVIEYLSQQKPVIATNIGEIEKMISSTQGMAGILLNLSEGEIDKKELLDAMTMYVENKELYDLHKKNANFAFEKFEMKNCIENYLKFFYQ